jgi:hypothetical protein
MYGCPSKPSTSWAKDIYKRGENKCKRIWGLERRCVFGKAQLDIEAIQKLKTGGRGYKRYKKRRWGKQQ